MSLKLLVASGLIATTLALGCDDGSSTTPATPATPATPSAGAMGDGANDAAASMQQSAADAQARTQSMMAGATTQAAAAGDAMSTQAQSLYDNATTAIRNAKFDDAQKYVDQLKAMRDKLPADWQTKVDQLGTMLTDAKAKMGNMPAMPR